MQGFWDPSLPLRRSRDFNALSPSINRSVQELDKCLSPQFPAVGLKNNIVTWCVLSEFRKDRWGHEIRAWALKICCRRELQAKEIWCSAVRIIVRIEHQSYLNSKLFWYCWLSEIPLRTSHVGSSERRIYPRFHQVSEIFLRAWMYFHYLNANGQQLSISIRTPKG
jgi:hypothetical protein